MKTYNTTFLGLPVTVNYESEHSRIDIASVEWRGIELQDGMTKIEMQALYGEMEMNLQAELVDAADYARQMMYEEQMHREAA